MPNAVNDDRLAKLELLPPPTTQLWNAVASISPETKLPRRGKEDTSLPLGLFWYAPDWYTHSVETTNPVAASVGRLGVAVTALRTEIAPSNTASLLHEEKLPRIVPYRPERYGLAVEDFDHATIIDIRLTMVHDRSGRFAFPEQQMNRWESRVGKSAQSSGGWVAAAPFPPDVASVDQLSGKVDQLRMLSPEAAIFVSLQPINLERDLEELVNCQCDGFILRVDRFELDGLSLAKLVGKTRRFLDAHLAPGTPLWIVPGRVSADDAAKLVALGASGVAIDSWCNNSFQLELEQPMSAAQRLGFSDAQTRTDHEYIATVVADHLNDRITRFVGLTSDLTGNSFKDRLGTFDTTWAESLGVRSLG